MPELPEVETTIRNLRKNWVDQTVKNFTATSTGKSQLNLSIESLQEKLVGARLSSLQRYGKWMLFDFEKKEKLNVAGHLRMSGSYLTGKSSISHQHKRFEFELENGTFIAYLDQRRFGTWHVVDDLLKHLADKGLGPDALSEEFNAKYLQQALSKLKKPIYQALLDQQIVAGLGNIYVNEALAASLIHPLSVGNKIPVEFLETLVLNTKNILYRSLELKGTTLLDNLYNTPEGKTGEFAKLLTVYGQKKNPEVTVIKIGGRSAFYRQNQILFS